MRRHIPIVILFLFIALVLGVSLRGRLGNLAHYDLLNPSWAEEGPFELSVERGRFALTFSIVEDRSVTYSLPIARFATPDLGYRNGKYVSLFAPGFSFLIIPGYLLGKLFGIAQIGTYAVVAVFALANTLLIYLISRHLSAHWAAAALAALVFIFATPAFAYSVSLYQHHISTFLLLVSLYLLIKHSNFWSMAGFWLCFGIALTVDYPNFFLFLPLLFLALSRLVSVQIHKVSIDLVKGLAVVAVLPPLILMGYFNLRSFGSPFQLAGTVSAVSAIDQNGLPAVPQSAINTSQDLAKFVNPDLQKKSVTRFFKSRNLLNGLYLHTISLDRGMVIFTPVVLFGVLGVYFLYKKDHPLLPILLGIVGVDLILYSLWGDPWGGWAFGSRYLIPSYAILAILLSVTLSQWRKNILVMTLFFLVVTYSLGVNALGALTTNSNPPQIEVLALEKVSGRQERYSFDRNWEFIKANRSKSFIYNLYFKNILDAPWYFLIIWMSIAVVTWLYFVCLVRND